MTALFWLDTWLLDESLVNCVSEQVPSELRDCAVRYFWNSNTGWRTDMLHQLLRPDIIMLLMQRQLLHPTDDRDVPKWFTGASGLFSTSSIRPLLRSAPQPLSPTPI